MAEKTREQWARALRRWVVVGAVVGVCVGVAGSVAYEGPPGLLGSVAAVVPMGSAMAVGLWASMYRFDFRQVWGGVPLLITLGVMLALMAAGVGIGCAQGICGENP